MAFRFFQNENLANKIPENSFFLSGESNADDGQPIESGFGLPWSIDPRLTWMTYNCWIECYLDSGMALHKPLPQSTVSTDTLSSQIVSPLDTSAPSNKNGVNLVSKQNFFDVAQRMATSTYRFCLLGYGIRAGYQIPIPGLKTVAGVPAIYERSGPCWNRVVGNLSGIPLFLASWELWYFVTLPPRQDQEPPPDFANAIRATQELPDVQQVAFSTGDYNSVPIPATITSNPVPPVQRVTR